MGGRWQIAEGETLAASDRVYTDQSGKKIPWEEFLGNLSESILANVIAFHRAGIPHNETKMIVGRDGGTIVGGGAMFQTPVARKLSEEEGKELFNHFKFLFERFMEGSIDPERINQICEKNRVDHKVGVIRKSL